ncbi:glutamate-5-semialdehyde dehydrogenase, partial [Azospirillum sp. B506]|uniref:glutamate-5-semialdehyde dehydrogenase n=1 Tax=Azospirillum sp. B506 TaxID=137721 RepID=UPI0005B2D1CF
MSALLDTTDALHDQMIALGRAARAAAAALATVPGPSKDRALRAAAAAIRARAAEIKAANAEDMANARDLSGPMRERLMLDDKRIEAMAKGLEDIADFPDPIGGVLADWTRPNGLHIQRVRVPLGVVGIIYESRPNVTADAGGICLKSGNAAILRGGSESIRSSRAIADCLVQGLREAGLPEAAIQLVPTTDRAAVGHMLTMREYIDVIIPRGGKSLIQRIADESRVPVIKHLDGNCHVYVDAAADLETARKVVLNAKMRRTSICGAAETLLVDRAIADKALPVLVKDLLDAGCAVRGDAAARAVDPRVTAVAPEDWDTEYLDAIIAC